MLSAISSRCVSKSRSSSMLAGNGTGAAPASVHRCIMPVAVGFRMRLLLIAGGLCCFMAALGQTEPGSIAGSVFDAAHAPAANVSIEARNTETGTDYKAVSSAKGEYTFAQLPPGKYDLFVIDAKYRPFVRRGIAIRGGQPAALEIQLASSAGMLATLGEIPALFEILS